jgi:ABC-type polysaccharide/polyol phosphate export permease
VLLLGHPFYVTWLYLPVPFLALVLLTLGATFLLAALNVYYRDVSHILQIVLQVWFYATPIIYPIAIFGSHQWVFKLNPLIFSLNGFRMGIYAGALPSVESIAASFVCGLVALVIGYAIFRKTQDQFVYYV